MLAALKKFIACVLLAALVPPAGAANADSYAGSKKPLPGSSDPSSNEAKWERDNERAIKAGNAAPIILGILVMALALVDAIIESLGQQKTETRAKAASAGDAQERQPNVAARQDSEKAQAGFSRGYVPPE